MDWQRLLCYKRWAPVRDEDASFVHDESATGMIRTTLHERTDGRLEEYAELTPIGYRFARRNQIVEERGLWASVGRFLYKYLSFRGTSNIC